jgi:hypothetical protein
MSSKHVFRAGFQGLRLAPIGSYFRSARSRYAAPLTKGSESSWLPLCRAGQDQGQDGACAVFAIAEWACVMQGRTISNEQRLAAYRKHLAAYSLPDNSGLSFFEAYEVARTEGWITGTRGLQMVLDFTFLSEQPLLLGYEIDEGWQDTNAAGCIDHRAGLDVLGNHAVLGVAAGRIGAGVEFAQFNNWWGDSWGRYGFGQLTMERHDEVIREMWKVIL